MHYVITCHVQITVADFNLAVSTAKPPNLIPCQIFRLYSMYLLYTAVVHSNSNKAQSILLQLETKEDRCYEAKIEKVKRPAEDCWWLSSCRGSVPEHWWLKSEMS